MNNHYAAFREKIGTWHCVLLISSVKYFRLFEHKPRTIRKFSSKIYTDYNVNMNVKAEENIYPSGAFFCHLAPKVFVRLLVFLVPDFFEYFCRTLYLYLVWFWSVRIYACLLFINTFRPHTLICMLWTHKYNLNPHAEHLGRRLCDNKVFGNPAVAYEGFCPVLVRSVTLKTQAYLIFVDAQTRGHHVAPRNIKSKESMSSMALTDEWVDRAKFNRTKLGINWVKSYGADEKCYK